MRLSRGKAFGTPLLRIEGDVDPDDAFVLERAAWEAFGATGTRIILDVKSCGHIGSVGLAVVRWSRGPNKEGGDGPSGRMRSVVVCTVQLPGGLPCARRLDGIPTS